MRKVGAFALQAMSTTAVPPSFTPPSSAPTGWDRRNPRGTPRHSPSTSLAMRGSLVVVAFLMIGCGGRGAISDSASESPTPRPTQVNAQEALDRALELLRERRTGSFEHVATIGAPDTSPVTTTQTGSFDLPQKHWQASLNIKKSGEPLGGPLQFIGTANAFYLTSPEWPTRIRGRWLRYTAADVESVAGGAGLADLSDGQPIAASVLFSLKPTAASSSPQGITVTAELPSAEALVLAHLKTGLIKNKVDVSTIKGVTEVTLELAPDGTVRRLKLATDALNGALTELPDVFLALRDQVGVLVTYDAWAAPLAIKVPTARQLVSPSEME